MERTLNVAITGSHGYIGSVLRKELTERGYNNICCDNKPLLGDLRYLGNLVPCSFDDVRFIDMVVESNCQTIFHLAASSLLGPSATDPLQYYYNNTSRTINMIKMLADRGWKGRIVFSSTAAVYGEQTHPVSEESHLTPCNHYGHSKLMCEKVLLNASMYGIKTTVFRYFNVAGAYDDVGQDAGEPHIITRICNAAAGRSPLVVYGYDYPTGDGSCIRDYVNVRDVCGAQIYAMENKVDGTFNLGTHSGTSVFDVISTFIWVTGRNIEYTIGDRREGDPAMLVAKPQKFIDNGFQYKYSKLNLTVKSAWEYFQNGL